MFFLHDSEIAAWYAEASVRTKPHANGRLVPTHLKYSAFGELTQFDLKSYPIARCMSELLGESETLLDAHYIDWLNLNNGNLYYSIRASYGNRMRMSDARGHCFLSTEIAERITFLQIALIGRWTFWMLNKNSSLVIEGKADEGIRISYDKKEMGPGMRKLLRQK